MQTKLEYLKARLAREEERQGWTSEHTDRGALKKQIRALEKEQLGK